MWQEEYYNMQYERSLYNYRTDGDTIINNLSYHKLRRVGSRTYGYGIIPPIPWHPFSIPVGFIREDNNKRIYHKLNSVSPEELLYDFNIALGDTIPIPTIDFMFDRAVVTAVDTVLVCSTMRKRYKLAPIGTVLLQDLYWTEGIGSTHGLIPRYNSFESGVIDVCYSDSNCMPPCPIILSSSLVNHQASKEANIYPNPSSKTSLLQLNNKATSTKIQIINNLGLIVFTKTTNKQEETLDLSRWSTGVYYVRLEYDQQVEIHTLIKQ